MPETEGEKLARLTALIEGVQSDIRRVELSIGEMVKRVDFMVAQSHENRIVTLEKRMGSLVKMCVGVLGTLITLILGLVKLVWEKF